MQGRDEALKGIYERLVGEGRELGDMTLVTTSASPDPSMESHGHTTAYPVGMHVTWLQEARRGLQISKQVLVIT